MNLLVNIRELYRYRELLWVWTQREIRVRYKQSLLGATWAFLQPLSLMVIFTVVFNYFVKVPSDNIPYPVFSYTALVPWTFFTTSISFAVPSLVNNMNLVTKIYFPREIFPIAALGAALMDYLIASILYLCLMIFYNQNIHTSIIWLPILLAIQIALTLGVSFLGATTIIFFRDVRFVVPLALQLWMYLTPIVYPLSLVPEKLQNIYLLNPMAVLIDSYRRVLLLGEPPNLSYLSIAVIIAMVVLGGGYYVFKRFEPTFADII